MRRGGTAPWLALAATLVLAACATTPPAPPPVTPPPPEAPPPPADGPASLPGWAEEDHLAALNAWSQVCHVSRDAASRTACEAARALPPGDAEAARRYFETWFVVEGGEAEGLLTAYFAPEYPARRTPDAEFSAAIHGRPADLVMSTGADGRPEAAQRLPDGTLRQPYPPRTEIEAMGLPALAWMRGEDKFFMQIQGSGYLTFEDGGRARAAYAANNGQPFVGIARPMAERGLLPPDGTSGEAIRAWLAANRGPGAQAIMDLNPRYAFFALEPDDGGHPAGAAAVPLPPGRAIAIDPTHWSLGELVWIEAGAGDLRGATRGYRGLVTALDTGGAIRGAVRADLYLGRGAAAGAEAGTVRHPLRMWRLRPRS